VSHWESKVESGTNRLLSMNKSPYSATQGLNYAQTKFDDFA